MLPFLDVSDYDRIIHNKFHLLEQNIEQTFGGEAPLLRLSTSVWLFPILWAPRPIVYQSRRGSRHDDALP